MRVKACRLVARPLIWPNRDVGLPMSKVRKMIVCNQVDRDIRSRGCEAGQNWRQKPCRQAIGSRQADQRSTGSAVANQL